MPYPAELETFALGRFTVPRLWNGLWQLSSNAWGSAPSSKIKKSMELYAQHGYTAFGKPSKTLLLLACLNSASALVDMVSAKNSRIPILTRETQQCSSLSLHQPTHTHLVVMHRAAHNDHIRVSVVASGPTILRTALCRVHSMLIDVRRDSGSLW